MSVRVPGGLRVQEYAVVACMQADWGFVQRVAHAMQVGAQLSRMAYALRFAARKCGGGPVQGQIAQSDLLHEVEATLDFGKDVASDLAFTAAADQAGKEGLRVRHRQRRQFGDGPVAPAECAGSGIQSYAESAAAGFGISFVPDVPGGYLAGR